MHLDAILDEASEHEPVGFLHAVVLAQGRRVVPLFRRPAEIVVGRAAHCQWRFELPSLAETQLRLLWDGVRLRVEELDPGCATRLDGAPLHPGPHRVRPGQPIVAGELAIEFELQLFSDEVTQIRQLLPPEALATADTLDEDEMPSTVIATENNPAPPPGPPPPAAPTPPESDDARRTADGGLWRCWVPPRNGAADDEPTVEWPVEDALRPTADLLERLSRRSLGRVPRRLAVLLCLLVVVSVTTLWLATARKPHGLPTVAESGALPFDEAARGEPRAMQPDKDLEITLRQGIEAYRRGHTADAVDRFSRLADATGDPSARLMVFILRTRGAVTP
jgi:hypothetical protein